MQQRVNETTTKAKQESQSNLQMQKQTEELAKALTHDYNPLENITCNIGDNACAAKHVSVIQRAGLFHPMSESRRAQSLLRLQRQYGNRFVQRVIAQHAIQTRVSEPIVQRQTEEEEEEIPLKSDLQRQSATDDPTIEPHLEEAILQSQGKGQPIADNVRKPMENAFGAGFSDVRTHTDTEANTFNMALNARAFTTGDDIFFRQGEYNPGSSSGRELLAHELTHVVQQRGGGVKKKMTVSQPGDALEREADEMARAVMEFGKHNVQRQTHPEMANRQTEEEEKERLLQSKRRSLQLQRQPEEEEEEIPLLAMAKTNRVVQNNSHSHKGQVSAPIDINEPHAIQAELGPGRPLEEDIGARMESVFGQNFSDVRLHTDAKAAEISQRLNAHALTVGQHIAFGAGKYRPGTQVGDALLAHELAHTIQQKDASASVETLPRGTVADNALEKDANTSSMGALAYLWRKTKKLAGKVAQNAIPRLRSGLRLSPNGNGPGGAGGGAGGGGPAPAPAAALNVSIGDVNAPNTPPSVKRIPPRKETDVAVDVTGWNIPMLPVTLSIDASGGGNGTAKINGKTTHDLTSSETVKLKGDTQTSPGKAGKLKLVAKQGTTNLAQSNAFSVAAYPIEIGFDFNRIMRNEPFPGVAGRFWGAAYDVTFESDSGVDGDCDKTKISENVLVDTATGLFAGATNHQSGFNPTTSAQTDHHATGAASAADLRTLMDSNPSSQEVKHQFFRFSCERSGIAEDRAAGPKVPTSGFKITRSLTVPSSCGGGSKYFLHVKKEGFANNGVAAGTVDDTSVKDAEV